MGTDDAIATADHGRPDSLDPIRPVLDALEAHIAVVGHDGRIQSVNQSWRRFAQCNGGDANALGEGADYLGVCRTAEGEGADYARKTAEGLEAVLAGQTGHFYLEYPCHAPDEQRWFIVRITRCSGIHSSRAVIAHENITRRKHLELRLAHEALYDTLTGLANRTHLLKRLRKLVQRAKRERGYDFSLLFLDFDRFKIINDSLGHEVGDELLIEIAGRLEQELASMTGGHGAEAGHLAARLGGDEFVVLLDAPGGLAKVEAFARQLLEVFRRPFAIDGRKVHSTASIGIVPASTAAAEVEDILRDADTAMYEAKRKGKNCFAVFDLSMRQRVEHELSIENALRCAIENDEFRLHYQPITCLQTGQLVGMEALLRWHHPQRGLLLPGQFLEVAEETGLAVPIGEWVLDRACRDLVAWRQADPTGAAESININVSRSQLMVPDAVATIERVIRDSGLPPHRIHLEITEGTALEDLDAVDGILQRIRSLGVRIDMDDFGKGHSSLIYLHRLPIDRLKIDRAFINHLTGSHNLAAVVHSITTLAENLGIPVIAEGIETAEQLAAAQALNCQFGQGYFFARPCPLDEFRQLGDFTMKRSA